MPAKSTKSTKEAKDTKDTKEAKGKKVSELMEEVKAARIEEAEELKKYGIDLDEPKIIQNQKTKAQETNAGRMQASRAKKKEEEAKEEKKPARKKKTQKKEDRVSALDMSPEDRVKTAAEKLKKIKDEDDRVNAAQDVITDKKYRRYLMSGETHSGEKLTEQEARFIIAYVETGDRLASYIAAGYKKTSNEAMYNKVAALLDDPKISDELAYMSAQWEQSKIASAEEILQYFTAVMRGEVEDQFGLEASLSERTKAAQELAKRQIDAPKKNGEQLGVTLSFTWEDIPGTEETEEAGDEILDSHMSASDKIRNAVSLSVDDTTGDSGQ